MDAKAREKEFAKARKLCADGLTWIAAKKAGLADIPSVEMEFYRAELVRDPKLAVKPTKAGVKNAREKLGHRWMRVAAYAGISVAKAKALYAEAGGDPETHWLGRGTHPGKREVTADTINAGTENDLVVA